MSVFTYCVVEVSPPNSVVNLTADILYSLTGDINDIMAIVLSKMSKPLRICR